MSEKRKLGFLPYTTTTSPPEVTIHTIQKHFAISLVYLDNLQEKSSSLSGIGIVGTVKV